MLPSCFIIHILKTFDTILSGVMISRTIHIICINDQIAFILYGTKQFKNKQSFKYVANNNGALWTLLFSLTPKSIQKCADDQRF